MSKWNAVVVSLWCGKYQADNDIDALMYRTFGNHDFLAISPIDGETATDVLKGMWDRTNLFSGNIKPGESIHNLFGIAMSKCCDEFWEHESRYLFVSEIQLNYKRGTDFKHELDSFKQELYKLLSIFELKEKEDFVFYYSLDCGDLLFFLKTNKYTDGADVINKITIKSSFKHYSYSVCGINTGMFLSATNYDEIIPKAVICSVFSDSTHYNSWLKAFKTEYPSELVFDDCDIVQEKVSEKEIGQNEEFVHMARIGNEDVCINIYNCDLNHFIMMLLLDNGVFSYENELVNAVFSRLRIQLDTKFNDVIPTCSRNASQGESLIAKLSLIWKNRLSEHVNPFVYKALVEVLVAIENLEMKEFAVDIQDCVSNVFPLFINKIEAFNFWGQSFNSDNFEKCYSPEDFNKDLILFTTGLMSIANGALHADKIFINVPGFNAVLCDVPAKLLVYYTAFVQQLVNTLNDTKSFSYRFILCPDLYLNIEVMPLFKYKNTDSQLLKARIPIKKLFDPQILLMELSHEAAHFVDTKIRSRKERIDFLAETISVILANHLLKPILFEDESVLVSEINIIKHFLPENRLTLDDALNHEWRGICEIFKQALLKDVNYEDIEEQYHMAIKSIFINNIQKLLTGEMSYEDKSLTFLDSVYNIIVDEENGTEQYEYILLLSEFFERHINQVLWNEYRMTIERSCDLFYESFADLVMLYITKDQKSYLRNIFEIEKTKVIEYENVDCYPWNECFIREMRFERIISVLTALGLDWMTLDSNDNKFSAFLKALKTYADKDNYKMRAFPYSVIDINTKYLKICLEKLEEKEDEIQNLRCLYQAATSSESAKKCIELFGECAYAFRKDLEEEHKIVSS